MSVFLHRYRLGDTWQADLQQWLEKESSDTDYWDRIEQERKALERELKGQKMLIVLDPDDPEPQQRVKEIRDRLKSMPFPEQIQRHRKAALEAAQELAGLPEAWDAAVANNDYELLGEMMHAIFPTGGITWDTATRQMRKFKPFPEYLAVLSMLLAPDWKQDGEYLTYQVADEDTTPWPWRSFTREQGKEIDRLHVEGNSVRQIAEAMGIGHMAVQRYLKQSKQ